MKSIYALIPVGLLAATPALAQPSLPPVAAPNTLPGDPDDAPPTVLPDGAIDQVPTEPEPMTVAAPATTTQAPAAATDPVSLRPTALAIGLGLGYVIPSDLSTPSITSARVRLATGLTFEPQLVLGHETTNQDDGVTAFEVASNSLEFGLAVRYPLRSHHRVDLSLVGGGAVSVTTVDPDGDDNNTQLNAFALSWGVGLDYWVNQHWGVSFTATNPILLTQSTTRQEAPGVESSTSRTTIAAIFDPTLAIMLHLYL